ncbi:MAG: hypothetical protein ABSH08_11870 [Tepidisphaeraceae bacterium]|jgi:hypothetical protein
MSMMRLGLFFRELAERETRTVILKAPALQYGRLVLPADEYGFDELYCVERACDCRRVMINVLARHARAHVATINHAFDPPSHDYDPPDQTFLDPLNRQSEWSDALLDIFVNVVLADSAYRQRLLRHYNLFKEAVADPSHPCQRFVRESELEEDGGGDGRVASLADSSTPSARQTQVAVGFASVR